MSEPCDYMTLRELATTLNVNYSTAWRIVTQKRLPTSRFGASIVVLRTVAAQFASQYDRESRGPKRWPGMRI